MPIYEYECSHCGHRMEKIQKISDEPLKDCPECETSSLRKLVSAAAFKLKGTGWYETDFKSSGEKNGKTKEGGGKDPDSKAEAKPDKKGNKEKEPKKATKNDKAGAQASKAEKK